MNQDRNFDECATEFEKRIYGTSKGYIRLNVLWTDIVMKIPQLAEGGLNVLDIGGGSGHIAVRVAVTFLPRNRTRPE